MTKLIGIAGGTCSGKTTLLSNLQDELGDKIATLTFDEYFIGSDLYNLDDITNFEDPKLYDWDKFLSDLKKIKAGQSLTIRANSRESTESGVNEKVIANRPIVIIEGFLIFHRPETAQLFDTKLFIELSDNEILQRRHARSRGSKHWDSHDYIQNTIIPYHHLYVEPQKELADYVVDGTLKPNAITERVIEYLNIK